MGTLSYDCARPIYIHFVCEIFIKTFIIIFISIIVHRLYMCDILDLYISLVNKSIDLIMLY